MILSKVQGRIVSSVRRHGTSYNSSGDTFDAILQKADVSQDMPRLDYTILAGYNASIHDGQIVSGEGQFFVPLKIDHPSVVNANAYKRVYMKIANASGDFSRLHEQANASTDIWDKPTGVEDVDYGWIQQKGNVWISMESRLIGDTKTDIGQQESTTLEMSIPMSVNASGYTPAAGDRFTDQNGERWRIQDIDGFIYQEQAYKARVSRDER